jgi:hypothetical protein
MRLKKKTQNQKTEYLFEKTLVLLMILKSIKNFLRIINKKCKKIQIENLNLVDQKVAKDMIQI